jgi:hypothetical protein
MTTNCFSDETLNFICDDGNQQSNATDEIGSSDGIDVHKFIL